MTDDTLFENRKKSIENSIEDYIESKFINLKNEFNLKKQRIYDYDEKITLLEQLALESSVVNRKLLLSIMNDLTDYRSGKL